MTITISDAATTIQNRLHLAVGEASTPPTLSMIQDDLRDAARHLLNTLRPVYLSEVTVDDELRGDIDNKGVILHVETQWTPLYQSEWQETNSGILITGYKWVEPDQKIWVWHTKQQSIATDAADVDVDCIHGADWIYTAMIHYGMMMAEVRLSNSGDVTENQSHMQRYRVLERMFEQEQGQLRAAREADLAVLTNRLQQRQAFGPGAWRENALVDFEDEVEVANTTTGAY